MKAVKRYLEHTIVHIIGDRNSIISQLCMVECYQVKCSTNKGPTSCPVRCHFVVKYALEIIILKMSYLDEICSAARFDHFGIFRRPLSLTYPRLLKAC